MFDMEVEVAGLGEEELKPIVSEAGGTVKAAGSSPPVFTSRPEYIMD
jgi:hypothetical protein